ncbi:MAG: CT583 family protein [Chlamydiales bacterium]|nr:CT583 family protein [Chlamydiales bacterium]
MTHVINSDVLMRQRYFERVFQVIPLDPDQSKDLELLLFESYQPGKLTEEEVGEDFQKLVSITAEIKAIHKQQVLLIGERIYQVRDLLKNYGDGQNTFTKWIERVFGSKRTAYNILRYYEFYHELPSLELKTHLKRMPLKAAYCLCNRQAPIDKKVSIIQNYLDQKPDDLILLIKEHLPIPEHDKRRKSGNQITIEKMKALCEMLKKRKKDLSEGDRRQIQEIIDGLQYDV